MRSVAVIDYGMGNLRSVLKAWEAAGAKSRLVSSPSDINDNDVLVFPGQGAIVDTMKLLKDTGFDGAIRSWIKDEKPFFGICLGLQALFEAWRYHYAEDRRIFQAVPRQRPDAAPL